MAFFGSFTGFSKQRSCCYGYSTRNHVDSVYLCNYCHGLHYIICQSAAGDTCDLAASKKFYRLAPFLGSLIQELVSCHMIVPWGVGYKRTHSPLLVSDHFCLLPVNTGSPIFMAYQVSSFAISFHLSCDILSDFSMSSPRTLAFSLCFLYSFHTFLLTIQGSRILATCHSSLSLLAVITVCSHVSRSCPFLALVGTSFHL